MRLLRRTTEPEVLARNRDDWAKAFAVSGKGHPESSTYAHKHIVAALRAMSHNKCFYCERPLVGEKPHVDHYIDVACDRSQAFTWANLYLSCSSCNLGKPPHSGKEGAIPVTTCVDPCGVIPVEQHLEFVGERVRTRNLSQLGGNTITKYKLGMGDLPFLRSQVLAQLGRDYELILERRLKPDGPRALTDDELARLRAYAGETEPFSACCRAWLEARGLW